MRMSDWSSDVCSSALVVGGEHQAELRGFVLHRFVQGAVGADVDAVEDAAQRQRCRGGQLRGQLHGFGFELGRRHHAVRSEEHTSELQSLMRISYAVFCLTKKKQQNNTIPQQS